MGKGAIEQHVKGKSGVSESTILQIFRAFQLPLTPGLIEIHSPLFSSLSYTRVTKTILSGIWPLPLNINT